MRDKVSEAEREEVCAQPVAEWSCLEAEWFAGDKSNVPRWVAGCPIRMPLDGVGGSCLLGMTQETVLRPTWQAVVSNHRNVRGLSLAYVDAHGASVDRVAQRAKPPSAWGQMAAFSSSTGKKLSSPAQVSS